MVYLRRTPVYKENTMAGFIPVEYEEDYSTVQVIDDQDFSGGGS